MRGWRRRGWHREVAVEEIKGEGEERETRGER